MKKEYRSVRAGEVHGAKNNEVREATKKSPQACARARDGERPVS
jgi:hypothetical protein